MEMYLLNLFGLSRGNYEYNKLSGKLQPWIKYMRGTLLTPIINVDMCIILASIHSWKLTSNIDGGGGESQNIITTVVEQI